MGTKRTIEQIAREDGRFHPEALRFVYEGLGYTIRKMASESSEGKPNHISGGELSKGLAELALEKWGRLARIVLKNWGINSTRDFGEIVYLMIQNHWMSAQDGDQIEDFDNIFDFETVFEKQFKILI